MKTYIKFVNSIFKDMNMKDFTFDHKDWNIEFIEYGVLCVSIRKEGGKPVEKLLIPWKNIVVIQES